MTFEEVWRTDYAKVCKVLEEGDWIATLDDGSQYIVPAAPAELAELYSRLRSIGYAGGWL